MHRSPRWTALALLTALAALATGGCQDATETTAAHTSAGCDDAAVAACVCADDDFCCTETWDGACVASVAQKGCGACP